MILQSYSNVSEAVSVDRTCLRCCALSNSALSALLFEQGVSGLARFGYVVVVRDASPQMCTHAFRSKYADKQFKDLYLGLRQCLRQCADLKYSLNVIASIMRSLEAPAHITSCNLHAWSPSQPSGESSQQESFAFHQHLDSAGMGRYSDSTSAQATIPHHHDVCMMQELSLTYGI